ncbi:hypothetical protein C427_1070 [Paraglaciecola psychrophila 170]|uniref:Uncharacterized protein n=1 Tax=Paraglaciecola psychrophila 170 TaxID=1129794 RepID=M4RLY9_9ALTE|nr:hypothetical protein C427_1070 [Paraglaciecola psychrophila 170]
MCCTNFPIISCFPNDNIRLKRAPEQFERAILRMFNSKVN